MLIYIYKMIIFQLVFLLFYEVLLKKSTFFNWNRAYLLFTLILSLSLPFISIEKPFQKYMFAQSISLPEIFLGTSEVNLQPINIESEVTIQENKQLFSLPFALYITVSAIILGLVLYRLKKIIDIKNNNLKYKLDNILIIRPKHKSSPFSFFNMIFIPKTISEAHFETILKHELVHVNHKHSYDLMLLSILKMVFWFNPLIYLYKNRLELTHEFIADRESTGTENRRIYINQLLNQAFKTQHINFINSYYKSSLMKSRIKMLQSLPTSRTHLFKFLLLIPLIAGCLLLTSTKMNAQENAESKIENNQELNEEELVQKYYDKYATIGDFGKIFESNDILKRVKTTYVYSFDDYCRMIANLRFIRDYSKKIKTDKGNWTQEDEKMYNNLLDKEKTYQDYLAYTKTLESKLNWESRTADGILRLVVDDIENFTEEEQIRYDKKMKMIDNDDFFTGLRICQTDGKAITFFGEEKEVKVINVNPDENSTSLEVPFAVIEDAPTTKDCKDASFEERKTCLSSFIAKFVGTHFNTRIAKDKGLTGRQRISVGFKIDKKGRVKDVFTRAAHPELEAEAQRVIKLLPRFVPGKHKGKTVVVPYSLPIVFEVK